MSSESNRKSSRSESSSSTKIIEEIKEESSEVEVFTPTARLIRSPRNNTNKAQVIENPGKEVTLQTKLIEIEQNIEESIDRSKKVVSEYQKDIVQANTLSEPQSDKEDENSILIYENSSQILEIQDSLIITESNTQIGVEITKILHNPGEEQYSYPQNKIEKNKMAELDLGQKIKISEFVRGIPTFSGKKDAQLEESLHIFLEECRNAMEMFSKDSEKEYFMSLAKSRLRGDARVLAASKTFSTVKELQDFLGNHYTPRKDPAEIIREINMIFQKPNETIENYAERLQGLVGLVYELFDQAHKDKAMADYYKKDVEKQAIRAFKFGIKEHNIQTALFLEKANTIEAIIKQALKWENIEKIRHNPLQYARNEEHTENSRTELLLQKILENMEIGTQRKQNPIPTVQMRQESRTNTNTDKYCDFCHRKNHTIAECRTKQNTPFCYLCHKYYHVAEQCFGKSDRNSRSFNQVPQIDFELQPNFQYSQRGFSNNQSKHYNNGQNYQQYQQDLDHLQQNTQPPGWMRNNYSLPYQYMEPYQETQRQEQPKIEFSPETSKPQFGVRVIQQNEELHNNSHYKNNDFWETNREDQQGNTYAEGPYERQNQGNDLGLICAQQIKSPK